MSVASILEKAAAVGVIFAYDVGELDAEGPEDAIEALLPELRLHKAGIILHLENLQRLTANEWIRTIRELDELIARYCQLYGGDPEIMLSVRKKQPLASIPQCLRWFRQQLNAIQGGLAQ